MPSHSGKTNPIKPNFIRLLPAYGGPADLSAYGEFKRALGIIWLIGVAKWAINTAIEQLLDKLGRISDNKT